MLRSVTLHRLICTLLSASVLAACGGEADRTRRDPAAPTGRLRETLRIGSGDEGPTSFSWVKGVATDARGHVFIYEHSTQDIRVFDAGGDHVRTIGRPGSGPGELRNAEGITIAGDGTLWVRDAANGRFSILSVEGAPLHEWPTRFCSSQGTWQPKVTASHLVDSDCLITGDRAVQDAVLGYRLDRSAVDTLVAEVGCEDEALAEAGTWITREARRTSYRPIPHAPRALRAFAGDGTVWCAMNSARYELLRLSPGGDTLRITRPVVPVPVSAQERDSIIAGIESRGPTGLDFSRIPAARPALELLFVDDDGRLWARRGASGGGFVFDIFRPDGTFDATLAVPPVDSRIWSPMHVRGDDVYLVVVDADDVPQVVRFQVERDR
jgi:hypothetical protein